MYTGEKIKLLRQLKGMNQEQLSERIGKTRALISHIEKTGKAHHETLLTIIKCFDITEEEFKNFEGSDIKIGNSNNNINLEAEIKEYGVLIDRLKKENKILSDMVSSQKDIIELLKEKTKK